MTKPANPPPAADLPPDDAPNEPIGFRRLIFFGLFSLMVGAVAHDAGGTFAGLCATAAAMGFCMEMYYVD